MEEEFGSGGGSNGGYSGGNDSNGGGADHQNNGAGNETGSEAGNNINSADKDFYRDFQKMLTHTMDISIARSTINLYL